MQRLPPTLFATNSMVRFLFLTGHFDRPFRSHGKVPFGSGAIIAVLVLAALTIPVTACSSDPPDSEVQTDAGTVDLGTPDVEAIGFPSSGEEFVTGCSGLNQNKERCYWRYRFDRSQLMERGRLSRLVLFFSGGLMLCDDAIANDDETMLYGLILKSYADRGYLAVCLEPFLEQGSDNSVTFVEEIERNHRVAQAVLESPLVARVWDGSELLISGVSHGATAPPVLMARTSHDETWLGSAKTGACLYDGHYDMLESDAFYRDNAGCSWLRSPVICQRYFGNDSCPAFSSTGTPVAYEKAMMDSVVEADPREFSVTNWKLIECGSGMDPCGNPPTELDGDHVPSGPIARFCTNLDQASSHQCDATTSFPLVGHNTCAFTKTGINACADWFESL